MQNDVWALGVITLEALTGQHPYAHPQASSGTVMCTVASGNCITIPRSGISGPLRSFLTEALQQDPDCRSSARELLNHPWVAEAQPLPLSASSSTVAAEAAAGGGVMTTSAGGGGVGSAVGAKQQRRFSQQPRRRSGVAIAAAAAAGVTATEGPSVLSKGLGSCAANSSGGGGCGSPWGLGPLKVPGLHRSSSVSGAGKLMVGVGGVLEGESPRAGGSLTDVLPFLKRSNSSSCGQSSMGKSEPCHFLETIDSWEY